jgi:hypothetical protein
MGYFTFKITLIEKVEFKISVLRTWGCVLIVVQCGRRMLYGMVQAGNLNTWRGKGVSLKSRCLLCEEEEDSESHL